MIWFKTSSLSFQGNCHFCWTANDLDCWHNDFFFTPTWFSPIKIYRAPTSPWRSKVQYGFLETLIPNLYLRKPRIKRKRSDHFPHMLSKSRTEGGERIPWWPSHSAHWPWWAARCACPLRPRRGCSCSSSCSRRHSPAPSAPSAALSSGHCNYLWGKVGTVS